MSASSLNRFTLGESVPVTHCIGDCGWGFRTGQYAWLLPRILPRSLGCPVGCLESLIWLSYRGSLFCDVTALTKETHIAFMIIVHFVKVSELTAAVMFLLSSSVWQVMWRHWPVADPQTVDVFCTARLINFSETRWQAVCTLQDVITASVSEVLSLHLIYCSCSAFCHVK